MKARLLLPDPHEHRQNRCHRRRQYS
jgi:hypothetical protein